MINTSSRQRSLADKREYLLAAIFSLAIIAAAYFRLYFGINFADEAYYVAIPFRFVLGDLPFRDESSSLFTMFSFISYPFFKVFYVLSGSAEGIILFARHLYLAFQIAIAVEICRILNNFVSRAEALLISSCVLAFVPFSIAGISYNTLSSGFLALGLLAGAWGVIANRPRYMVTTGFVLTLSIAAYPPMLVVGFVALIYILSLRKKSIMLFSLLGCVLAIAYILPLLRYAEWSTIRDNLEYVLSFGGQQVSIWTKARMVVENNFSHLWIGIAACGIVCTALVRNGSAKVLAAVAILPLVLAKGNRFPTGMWGVTAHGFVMALALIGPWIYRGIHGEERNFFKLVWIPSAIAAFVMGCCSSNGYLNSGIGFLGGGIVSLTMLLVLLRDKYGSRAAHKRVVRLFIPASAAGILIFYQYATIYWESRFDRLNTPITSGPYKFLRTTSGKACFVEHITNDVHAAADKTGTIVYYYNFPAGYLFSNLKPATNAVWLFSPREFPGVDTSFLERYYSNPAKLPDIVIKFHYIIRGNDIYQPVLHVSDHPIDKLLSTGSYRIVNSRKEYDLFRKM